MIFLDASFLINLYVEKNENHDQAVELWKDIENEDKIISKFIITEILTVFNNKIKPFDIDNINRIYNLILNDCEVIDDFHYFNQTIVEFFKNNLGFFDTLYIVLLKDLNIERIASFDEHFDNKEGIIRVH